MKTDALPAREQEIIDRATHDGEGWTISDDLPDECIEALASKGLIHLWKGRWQLTPTGFTRSAMFR